MKILVLVTSYPNKDNKSANIFVHNQVKVLQKNGFLVDVMYIDIRSIRRKRKWFFKKYEFDGVQVYRYALPCGPIDKLGKILSSISVKRCYKKYLKYNENPDIIHAHFFDAGRLAYIIKKKYGVNYVITEHSSLTPSWMKKSYDGAKEVLAVSEFLKQRILNVCSNKVTVLPNILSNCFKITGTKEKEFTFICVARLIKGKRVDMLILAFKFLVEKYDSVRLTIVGQGIEEKNLKQQAIDLGIIEKIDFVGSVQNTELPKYYNKSTVFVLPSISESFGVVYIEAMACGLPVIATKCGGPEDFVNEKNGVLLPVDVSIDGLFRSMEEIMVKYNRYDIKQISDDIIAKFGEEAFFEKIKNVYYKE